jgi:hypothetical protein
LEVAHVRNQLRGAIEAARQQALARRQRLAAAEQSFAAFLERATPVLKQLTTALKAEGFAFTLFTPERALRLAYDRSRIDFVELTLETEGAEPGVLLRSSYGRGSRTVAEERPLKAGAAPDDITDDELLATMLQALAPWLER